MLVELRRRGDPTKNLKAADDISGMEGLLANGGDGRAYRKAERRVLVVGEVRMSPRQSVADQCLAPSTRASHALPQCPAPYPRTAPSAHQQADSTRRPVQADFSWTAALLDPLDGATPRPLLMATSFDSREEIGRKYGEPHVAQYIGALCAAGVSVLHRVDATALQATEALRERAPFDVIVFQFPHVGTDEGLQASIAANRQLVQSFLASARCVLAPGGEVHLSLVHRYPYTTWLGELGKAGSKVHSDGGRRVNASHSMYPTPPITHHPRGPMEYIAEDIAVDCSL